MSDNTNAVVQIRSLSDLVPTPAPVQDPWAAFRESVAAPKATIAVPQEKPARKVKDRDRYGHIRGSQPWTCNQALTNEYLSLTDLAERLAEMGLMKLTTDRLLEHYDYWMKRCDKVGLDLEISGGKFRLRPGVNVNVK